VTAPNFCTLLNTKKKKKRTRKDGSFQTRTLRYFQLTDIHQLHSKHSKCSRARNHNNAAVLKSLYRQVSSTSLFERLQEQLTHSLARSLFLRQCCSSEISLLHKSLLVVWASRAVLQEHLAFPLQLLLIWRKPGQSAGGCNHSLTHALSQWSE